MQQISWMQGFTIDLNSIDKKNWTVRHLSQMTHMFQDQEAAKEQLSIDPVIYAFQELDPPDSDGTLAFGLSTVYPGKIGNEYYMTKGHFHNILQTGELYYVLEGHGLLLIENGDGDSKALTMEPGLAVYVPEGYAHRSINTGEVPMTSLFCFRADAGHDYKTIETLGFRNCVVEKNDTPTIVPNKRWNA